MPVGVRLAGQLVMLPVFASALRFFYAVRRERRDTAPRLTPDASCLATVSAARGAARLSVRGTHEGSLRAGRTRAPPGPGIVVSRSAPLRLEPDPRAPDWSGGEAWARKQKRPLAADLFAGGAGLSLGLENAGCRVVLAADHDA